MFNEHPSCPDCPEPGQPTKDYYAENDYSADTGREPTASFPVFLPAWYEGITLEVVFGRQGGLVRDGGDVRRDTGEDEYIEDEGDEGD